MQVSIINNYVEMVTKEV